ncbi:aldehyde dehydrogenase family protein [Geodermatophilus obscurus]|uniref:aldehyde dehydrogenase (NAD(+)) n=1 Tax=Geodermatophilus obscurus (strain ATCC 25078 / DSM 43160 / JCM 3152 / CCUG 61914 / KCC A-0152 / KCTC 9177 / NBRC 13315 / NRRL B-3577 / G-20) TaxID=526225 RepID=D2SEG6_GEOOG|nr:aldehyde dehydrogenase family protein [Geodermatophilus obscurus]ADB74638.1 Aldehyde Dehydrogenase [Geodermatophilus obscurus DSM 43160]
MTTTLPTADDLRQQAQDAARRCGVDLDALAGDHFVTSPVNGQPLSSVRWSTGADVDGAVARAVEAFRSWRTVPAPVRGGLVRRFGELLREHKADLGTLVSLEVGKITSEAEGEVQEMIDICEFAVGLSRQLYGRTISSERPGHRLMETWHPLGVVGVISAFNFPAAVWSWNTAIALVCGDPVVWKPSELAPLTAAASAALLDRAIAEEGAPEGLSQVLIGGPDVGEALVDHPGVALLSATGSTRMGRAVGPRVADRFGRSLLELGGNNAAIVTPSADLDLTTRGIVFSAAGTAGQRCTTMRRVIAHVDVIDELTERVAAAYRRLPIGSPVAEGTLVGPLVHGAAYKAMQNALEAAGQQGGELVVGGGRRFEDEAPDAYYAEPAIVRMPEQTDVVRQETFAPILYVLPYRTLEEAIALNNDVPQGLSSSIFTSDQAEAERFLAADGSDCGIANVNIGTSGAEIGGAFGGEKETGGGRESGSDAWRSYMRRATNTINYSGELPLAQGVKFTV